MTHFTVIRVQCRQVMGHRLTTLVYVTVNQIRLRMRALDHLLVLHPLTIVVTIELAAQTGRVIQQADEAAIIAVKMHW